jgi:hypothetical protein
MLLTLYKHWAGMLFAHIIIKKIMKIIKSIIPVLLLFLLSCNTTKVTSSWQADDAVNNRLRNFQLKRQNDETDHRK